MAQPQIQHPLHASTHRKAFETLSAAKQDRLRQLIDQYISTQNPVAEHAAAAMDPGLMIHTTGFLAWHAVFIGKLENWLVTNNAAEFVPLPYWFPSNPVPAKLNKNNTDPHIPFPPQLMPGPIAGIPDYMALNDIAVPYHNDVHDNLGGLMPNPMTSPGDPIFWPFHAFLVAVYEHWRSH